MQGWRWRYEQINQGNDPRYTRTQSPRSGAETLSMDYVARVLLCYSVYRLHYILATVLE